MKLFNFIGKTINFITYIGALGFIFCVMFVGELVIKITLEKLPVYFPTHKHDDWLEVILWIGWGFVVLLSQQFAYKYWKSHLRLETL